MRGCGRSQPPSRSSPPSHPGRIGLWLSRATGRRYVPGRPDSWRQAGPARSGVRSIRDRPRLRGRDSPLIMSAMHTDVVVITLLETAQARPVMPTFAHYIPVVAEAVGPGSRRVYGSYWNFRLHDGVVVGGSSARTVVSRARGRGDVHLGCDGGDRRRAVGGGQSGRIDGGMGCRARCPRVLGGDDRGTPLHGITRRVRSMASSASIPLHGRGPRMTDGPDRKTQVGDGRTGPPARLGVIAASGTG